MLIIFGWIAGVIRQSGWLLFFHGGCECEITMENDNSKQVKSKKEEEKYFLS
ncbi:hypothetical protein [Pantoea sp. At-9b]|uniref:hypothetical protein n=1 Tax=Pantoea sp. (strain At-9b) TaxID=592316 RepID=UPI0002E30071|nr:hypothetical protein [Pantoea sp. At-9b]